MPRVVTPVTDWFDSEVKKALELVETAERARVSILDPTIKRDFSIHRVELIYELAYLRIFVYWEQFLEESFVRYLCGYTNSVGQENLIAGVSYNRKIDDARTTVYGGSSYLLWHNPQKVINRARRYFYLGLHETVILSNFADLEHFANIRHRIAHLQEDARLKFDRASMSLCGRRFLGSRPGKLLRNWASTTERWIERISRDLLNLAKQITP